LQLVLVKERTGVELDAVRGAAPSTHATQPEASKPRSRTCSHSASTPAFPRLFHDAFARAQIATLARCVRRLS
jgi:hypothetical protein